MTSGRALFQPRTLGTINSMDTEDTMAFLKEREAKLGAPMKFRTYCTWFAKLGGERRDYGVFLYTDGRTMVYEDFERDPMILGIPINRKRKEKYVKMEESFPVDSITDVQRVTPFKNHMFQHGPYPWASEKSPSTPWDGVPPCRLPHHGCRAAGAQYKNKRTPAQQTNIPRAAGPGISLRRPRRDHGRPRPA